MNSKWAAEAVAGEVEAVLADSAWLFNIKKVTAPLTQNFLEFILVVSIPMFLIWLGGYVDWFHRLD
ncbi:MAG: hypothetical protein P8173_03940 [Gammaproteobacteria bacterium]